MALYILYRIGYLLVNSLPLRFSYGLASFLADICYLTSRRDREAIIKNLKTIMGGREDRQVLKKMARELYRNFAKYLVDFFRFAKFDKEYVKKIVKIEGVHNIDTALAKGKGVVIMSAHIGNWELGAFVVSLLGYPISAVVLPHRNKDIDAFFRNQRLISKLKPIEIGAAVKECYKVLKSNKLLALLGDRDFTKNGLKLEFFGRATLFPKGASAFAYRLGSAIVPTLIVRQPDDSFRMIFEEPVYADRDKPEDESVEKTAKRCAAIIESYVRRYPTQWYVFKDMWSKDE